LEIRDRLKKLNSIHFQLLAVFILFMGLLTLFFSLNIKQIQNSSNRIVLENVSANTEKVLDSITKSMAESETTVQILSCFVPTSALSEDSSVWYFFYKDLQTTIGLLESKDYQEANPHYFSYNYVQDYFLRSNTHSVNVYEEKALGAWLKESGEVKSNSWQDIVLKDTHYYIYTMKKGDFYLGVFVTAPAILDKFVHSSSDETEFVLMGNNLDYLITASNSSIESNMYESFYSGEEEIRVNGRKATIQTFSSKYGFTIKAVISPIMDPKSALWNTGAVIIIISGILIFIFYFITLRKCIKPLVVLQYAFSRVSAGDLSFRMRENMFSYEYNEVAKAFNMMVREIKDLRMNYYEEKILQQQAENRYLRAITYPHFLLNNLNLINNFAYENNEQGIHDVVLNLSKYLRYFITADFDKHTLRNDMESAKSYLNLNSLAYPNRLTYTFDIDEELLNIAFPPLIISTIVENCIKHGLLPGEVLDIRISLEQVREDEGDKLVFKCINSGPSFPEDIVASINSKETPENITTHVGLMSIKNTLNSQYKDHVTFRIDNNDNGVVVSIRLDMNLFFDEFGNKK